VAIKFVECLLLRHGAFNRSSIGLQKKLGDKMKAVVWSKDACPFCDQAKALLTQKGIAFEERRIGEGYTREQLLEAVPTARTVPQIFLDGEHVGGFTELKQKLTS
jgi:glutaredoxin 3